MPIEGEKKLHNTEEIGTLAIDLGNSTTVVAFQAENNKEPILLDLPTLTRIEGEIPSLVYFVKGSNDLVVGNDVIKLGLNSQSDKNLCSDFKRWIGAPALPESVSFPIEPEKAGEILLHKIWEEIPKNKKVKRLVLTAPVETYRAYREWLQKVCKALPVEEIALVDEPTAAAMGAGVNPGSKLLVVDIGGSTIDLSLVALEGGEGKAEPIAQLMRFQGEDLQGQSKQVLRCAKVLGKAGLRLGGRDIDRWIVNYLYPNEEMTEALLNSAEKLKCRLSKEALSESEYLIENTNQNQNSLELRLNKSQLEELLIEKGFLNSMKNLLNKTLAGGRAKKCDLKDLIGIVAVGGGARIPLIRKWLKEETSPISLLTPPPIEAVAKGALRLTPGVRIKDVLQKGVSLRCWNEIRKAHMWHPLFISGQTWPTQNGLEITLAASKNNQLEIELIIGEPDIEGAQEIIYINGIPTIKEGVAEIKVTPWKINSKNIILNTPGEAGKDCVKLIFNIDESSELIVEGIDLRSKEIIEPKRLGSIR